MDLYDRLLPGLHLIMNSRRSCGFHHFTIDLAIDCFDVFMLRYDTAFLEFIRLMQESKWPETTKLAMKLRIAWIGAP